jgi:hypothetical protein
MKVSEGLYRSGGRMGYLRRPLRNWRSEREER